MKKSFMNNLDNDQKMAASEYKIEVHHKSKEVVELNCTQYSFEDVFEFIKEYYSDKSDEPINKVVIQVQR